MSNSDRLKDKIKAALARREELGQLLASPEVIADPERLRSLGQEYAGLERVCITGREYLKVSDELKQARDLSRSGEDEELRELALAEVAELEDRIGGLESEVRDLLAPRDPLDDRAALIEIRAGTGGDEAGLFAA
ncbi:MAG: PCRF domain-containing protein, partial [Gemmatimonadota bacterium]